MAAWHRLSAGLAAALAVFLLAACGANERQPLRIGFIGSFTGGGHDLVIGVRNGAQQAIDEFNAGGGHGGRLAELVLADMAVDPPAVVIEHFRQQGVELVIGPLLSGEALKLMASPGAGTLVFVSPSVTTPDLSGRADSFFRVVATTAEYAASMAQRLYARGLRTAAVTRETTNPEYSQKWQESFEARFAALGGRVVVSATLEPDDPGAFDAVAGQIASAGVDVAVVIGRPLDVARLAQRLRAQQGRQPVLASAEWGGGESLPELGGRAVEGLLVQQFFDRDSIAARYLSFAEAYEELYRQVPGFASVLGHDAATAVIAAVRQRRAGESALDAMRGVDGFAGLQQALQFDVHGDTSRPAFLNRVEAGRFVRDGG